MEVLSNYIQPDRVINQIKMNKNFSGKYLFLEGKKDYHVYCRHLNESEDLKLIICHGKYKQREIWDQLSHKENRFIAIRDADFIRIRDKYNKYYHNSFFLTDNHDSETMILGASGMLNLIISQSINIEKKELLDKEHPDIFNVLSKLIYPLGCLKLASKNYELGLVFKPERIDGKSLDIKKFIDFNDLSYKGHDLMIQTCLNYSQNRGTKLKDNDYIKEKLAETLTKQHSSNEIINGHDFSLVIFHFLDKKMKIKKLPFSNSDDLENYISACFDGKHFKKTMLYKQLLIWQIINNFNLLDI